ncbi:MAG: transposase family protein [Dietzia sp.]|nr:transposase family protein [Dietzia sp.]
MTSRAEITTRYAKAYVTATKKDKGEILNQVVEVTGWSRDNARRRLAAAAKQSPGPGRQVAARPRKPRTPKFSYDARKVLQKVWAASGGQCGKYLAASMRIQLDGLERHGELVAGEGRYNPQVREELLAMSAATIDRYLEPAKARDQLRGKTTTKPSPLLRNSITVRKAGDEVEAEPGFFEGDTVAHCGPTLKGEFARTVNLTDVHTGWVFTRTVRNNATVNILSALKAGVEHVPFEVVGLDFDNGSEFLNHGVIAWAADRQIFFTRSRPYKKNDQATIESKNNHLVRRYGFYYRYDTATERKALNRLWPLVNDRLNYLTPTRKPIGYDSDRAGRRRRVYDAPATPLDRLLAAGVLSSAQETELLAYRDSLNPAKLGRQIHELQKVLLKLAKDKTDQLYLASVPTELPDVRRGIRVQAS